jgi:hypothetical protein
VTTQNLFQPTNDANIVQNKEFENAGCKITNGFTAYLTNEEKSAVQGFQKAADKREVGQSSSFADGILATKMQCLDGVGGGEYTVKWIPPTSNIVERLFSRAKLTVGELRQRLTPMRLEAILFLI